MTRPSCSKCGGEKFFVKKNGRRQCQACHRKWGRESKARRRAADPQAVALEGLRYLLKSKFGMTLERFSERHEEQNGRCAICEDPIKKDPTAGGGPGRNFGLKGRGQVDHDHATGKARGLLCARCNVGLGMFRDNPRVLEKAARYLVSMPFVEEIAA